MFILVVNQDFDPINPTAAGTELADKYLTGSLYEHHAVDTTAVAGTSFAPAVDFLSAMKGPRVESSILSGSVYLGGLPRADRMPEFTLTGLLIAGVAHMLREQRDLILWVPGEWVGLVGLVTGSQQLSVGNIGGKLMFMPNATVTHHGGVFEVIRDRRSSTGRVFCDLSAYIQEKKEHELQEREH